MLRLSFRQTDEQGVGVNVMNSLAQNKLRRLWQRDDLVHFTTRYSRKPTAQPVDRLAAILRDGLVAPAASADGSVCSDLSILAEGMAVPYDSLVFLHRFGDQSFIYTISAPGRFGVFVEPSLPVITPQDLAPNWVVLCRDEVYVKERVAAEKFIALVVHPDDAQAVLTEFQSELERLALPLYLYDGTVVWPS